MFTAHASFRRRLALIASLVLLVLAGCGGDDATEDSGGGDAGGDAKASITAPPSVKKAGKLVFCSDIPYPPMEFGEKGSEQGVDIEMGNDLAKRMGVTAEYRVTGFDGIIAALKGEKCDAILSAMTVTPEREKTIGFVKYAQFGLSLVVQKGNKDVTDLQSLAGKTVAVQVATTSLQKLEAENKKINPKISIKTFPKDPDAASALRAGKVQAYLTDAPPAAWAVKQASERFQLAESPQIDPSPFGIGIRKEDTEMRDALQQGIDAMTKDGSLEKILKKWGFNDAMLQG